MTRATDLPVEARAFLDALSVGESGGADDDAAYSVLFGGAHFGPPHKTGWPTSFPQWPGVWVHGVPTHAAGRYQFEPATWRDVAGRYHLPDFSPVSQDHAAWQLADEVHMRLRRNSLLNELSMASDNALATLATTLRSTWTSLSAATFPARYRAALAKLTA